MVSSERREWERESILEDVWVEGFKAIPRIKYLELAGHSNWCASAHSMWFSSWKSYFNGQRGVDLTIVQVKDLVLLIDPKSTKTGYLMLSDIS